MNGLRSHTGDRKATKDSHMRKLLLPPLGLGREREEMVLPEVGAVQQRLPDGNGSQRGWSYTGNDERQTMRREKYPGLAPSSHLLASLLNYSKSREQGYLGNAVPCHTEHRKGKQGWS